MQTENLQGDLYHLKAKLENVEAKVNGHLKEFQSRDEKWKKMDEKIKNLKVNEDQVIKMNVGGTPFATKLKTLINIKDTLFYKIVVSEKFDFIKVLFFDRFDNYFGTILNYLRYNKINYKMYNKRQLEEFLIEAEYYELYEISKYINSVLKDIRIIAFEVSSPFIIGDKTIGTQKVEFLNNLEDRSLKNGIVANSNANIIFSLNEEWEIENIEVGGWNGNPSVFSPTNGGNATIHTSKDRKNWTSVGTLPHNFGGYITTVQLTRSSGIYIKFTAVGGSYIGIGYLRINKKL